MATDLYSLAYVSHNTIAATGAELEAEIDRILGRARDNNRRLGVTGALLYSAGCFAQVLEGPLAAVETVFEQIQCDPRHRDVTVLHFKPAESRSFAGWSMAYAGARPGAAPPLALDPALVGSALADPALVGSALADPGLADPTAVDLALAVPTRNAAGQDLVAVLHDLIERRDQA